MTYSYTQISQYLSCPRRYRYRYLDGWQEKDTRAAMLFGRCFEKALAAYFRREDAAVVLFQEWSAFRDADLEYPRNDGWDRMLHQGFQLLDRFAQDQRIRVPKPRQNQQIKFTRRLSGQNDFIAYIDALGTIDAKPCVLEWKTTGTRYPDEPAGLLALDPQLVCYSWITGISEVAQVVFVRKRLVEIQYLTSHHHRRTAPGVRSTRPEHGCPDRVGGISAAQRRSVSAKPLRQLFPPGPLPR